MSLTEYRKKRDFKLTREPRAGKPSSQLPIFVVQEHHASHLHYDFRLEAFGKLKSWAIPKGPSAQVGDKRLAVEVEDHPISYANFKGKIPEGQYGAGTVKIWDKGLWIPPKNLKENLEKGHLEFELKGRKLKGRWLLQRTKQTTGKKHQWLLIKRHDIAKQDTQNLLKSTTKAKKPDPWLENVSPQLALLVDQVPKGAKWIHEIKFDGYRTLAKIKKGKVELITRNGLDWTEKYVPLDKEFKKLKLENAIFDGEIIVPDEKGHSHFSSLQIAIKNRKMDRALFYLFDLLYLNGNDLRSKPLEIRKQLLKKILQTAKSKKLIFSEHRRSQGEELFEKACQEGQEGIICKDRTAPYRSGRGGEWQKVKCSKNQEFVIGGYTDPQGNRMGLGALLVGTFENKKFRYVGRVGTGFSDELLSDLIKKLQFLSQNKSPFIIASPKGTDKIHWVKPRLVAEIEFNSWTNDGILRHASFQGLREDKKSQEVHIEKPIHNEKASVKTKSINIEADFKISHPGRLLYPKLKISKLDVASYYKSIAPWFLKYSGNRPLSLLRCLEQAGENCFFQKHISNLKLNSAKETLIEDQKVISIDSEEGLLQLVQWGALEFHAWQCHIKKPTLPDQIVFDLDPDESISWQKVVKTALLLKNLLENLSLQSFLKTTGGKGLHIHVPIASAYSWEQVKSFAKSVCLQLQSEYPDSYTTNTLKNKRKGKIFLDYLRNGFGATAIAPYSLRSKAAPYAAVPIHWKEMTQIDGPQFFDLKSTLHRLVRQSKDPWEGYLELKQKIEILDVVRNPKMNSSKRA